MYDDNWDYQQYAREQPLGQSFPEAQQTGQFYGDEEVERYDGYEEGSVRPQLGVCMIAWTGSLSH